MSINVGICSWSLQPASAAELVSKVRATGLDAVQLALDPIRKGEWGEIDTVARLRGAGIEVLSGMMGFRGEDYSTLQSIQATGGVRSDEHWAENLAAVKANARIARRLGVGLVTLHAGFLPHNRADPLRSVMLERLGAVVDAFDDCGVRVGFETGQESAETLLEALADLDRPHAGVNFDPANMILYGMGDAVDALRKLLAAGRVVQVHVKDALPTGQAGTWGQEVPVGQGTVDWTALFAALREAGGEGAGRAGGQTHGCDLLIEREAGGMRIDDIRGAAAMVARHLRTGSGVLP